MSRKCTDCVNYNECREIFVKWYSWRGEKPDMTKRNANHCARYMTLDEIIRQYEKENENGL